MKIHCLILLGLLSGCGRGTSIFQSDSVFIPYIEQFEREMGVRVRDLLIQFGEVKATEAGECQTGFNRTPTVIIDREQWELADDDERTRLVFHELGHCVLHKGHETELGPFNCPASIMYPIVIGGQWDGDWCWHNLQNYYIEELELSGN